MKGCRVLTKTEIAAIRKDLTPRDDLFMLTGLTFGLRVSESLALTFGDVSGMFLNVVSKKGSENVTFPIPTAYRAAVDRLAAYYANKGIDVTPKTVLFLSRKGTNKPITKIQASQIMQALKKREGLSGNVNTHSLRKSFATEIYQKTDHNIAETRKYTRHKSLASATAYIATTEGADLIHALSW